MLKYQLFLAIALAICSTTALANDDKINYSFSLKDWNHKFKQSTSTEAVNSAVVSGTARKGDYFITASTLLPTTYSFGSGSELFRRDTDLALGYSINSNVSFLAGQKNIGVRQYNTSNGWTNYKINLTYIGVNGFTSIGEKTFLYGTFTNSVKGKATDSNSTMKFTNYEGGLGYVMSKDTQLTVGYRNQKFTDTGSTTLPGIIFGVNIIP
jgi:hypothetical protein